MSTKIVGGFKKPLMLFVVLFSYSHLAFGANPSPSTFSSVQDEIVFNKIQENHNAWMMELEHVFGNPAYDVNQANRMQAWWEQIRDEIPQRDGEVFFGKEFYLMFLSYHQNRVNSMVKLLKNDFKGAKASLSMAKADAEQLKRLPMRNKEHFSHLFVDKMYLEAVVCLGVLEFRSGNVEAGMAALRAARDEASKYKWYWGKSQAAYYMALYAEWAKVPTAKAIYKEALEVAREKRTHYFTWKCCFQLARMQMDDGYLESAIFFLEDALISIEFMRTKTEEDVGKLFFMSDKFPVYRLLTQALLKKGEFGKALETSENVKSRVLQELLDSSHTLGRWGADDYHLVMQEHALSESMEALEDTQGKDAETQLAALRKEEENVLSQIRQKNPDYGVLKIGASADVKDIQALLDEKEALLEYNLMPECLIAWLVTKNSLRVETIPIPMGTINQNIQAIRMMMGNPKSPAVYKLLGQLYASIIQPFDKEIKGKHLVIVPDGALHYLPFAALMDAKGKFLVENHTISVVPSFTVLKYCMAKKKGKPKSVLAFGNPDLHDPKMDLPNAQLEVKSIAEHFSKLDEKAIAEKILEPEPSVVLRSDPKADLPNAQLEVKNISGKFPLTEIYLRKEATETLAKKIMGNFDIIHFACHGETVQSGDPMDSCLRLAPDETNDGKLTAGEIFDLKLNAQLVILSGCETGRGELAGGDEMIGLTRSFLYAGSPCLMVSLWKVDDSATYLLMGNLYENLAKSGRAEALRAAQMKTMETKKHPYYWAAFYLVGDGR